MEPLFSTSAVYRACGGQGSVWLTAWHHIHRAYIYFLLLESLLDLKAQNFQGYKGKHWRVHVWVRVEGAQGLGDTDDTVVILLSQC